MIDLIVVGITARKHGEIAEKKGHPKGKSIGIAAGLGIGGEIIGAILGFVLSGGDEEVGTMLAAVVGIIGLTVGLLVAKSMVNKLPDISKDSNIEDQNVQTASDNSSSETEVKCPKCSYINNKNSFSKCVSCDTPL